MFENFAEMGGNVPNGMIELLKETQYNIGSESVKKVKKMIDSLFGGDGENGSDK